MEAGPRTAVGPRSILASQRSFLSQNRAHRAGSRWWPFRTRTATVTEAAVGELRAGPGPDTEPLAMTRGLLTMATASSCIVDARERERESDVDGGAAGPAIGFGGTRAWSI